MNGGAKISMVEGFLLVSFALIADALNWIPVLNWVITVVTLPSYQIYFMIKGVKGYYNLAGNLAELLPVLSALPAITAGVVATIIVDRVSASRLGKIALKPTKPLKK